MSAPRWAFNVFVIFVLSGLWHGAKWSLVSWGVVSALILIGERLSAPARHALQRWTGLDRVPVLAALIQWSTMFGFWMFSLVFFRSDSLADAIYILGHLQWGWHTAFSVPVMAQLLYRLHLDTFLLFYCIGLCPIVELVDLAWKTPGITDRIASLPGLLRALLDWMLILAILVLGSFGELPFVYFQF